MIVFERIWVVEKNNTMVDRVSNLIASSKHVVFLTGAGISVPSGIPDFRSEGGLWSKYDPSEYATLEAFMLRPEKVWKMFWDALKLRKKAKPNPAHFALADIEKYRKRNERETIVITQNVDGLHQQAGSSHVLELHGSATRARCMGCRSSYDIDLLERQTGRKVVPKCDFCGAVLKLDVVLFGETLDHVVFDRSKKEADKADAIIATGTSLEVYPAADLFESAKGKKIFLNLEKPSSKVPCDFVLIGDIAKTLPLIAERVRLILED